MDAVGSWKNGKLQGEELENKEVKQREWWLVTGWCFQTFLRTAAT